MRRTTTTLRRGGLLTSHRGMRGGKKLKAVIPGGSSAPVLPADIMMNCTMDYDSIAKAGSMLGSGAVIVMDETRDMVESLLRLSYFYMHESCGQCTPCREGTAWMTKILERIRSGHGKLEDLDTLLDVAESMGIIPGTTICGLSDGAAWPVKNAIRKFRPEFDEYIRAGRRSMTPAQELMAAAH